PPEFDPDSWSASLDEIERRGPKRLALIHFGVADDVERHLAELRERLREWSERVRDGASEEEFEVAAAADLGDDRPPYKQAMPFCATEPVRARPSPTRRATRSSELAATGVSVATTTMQLPAAASRPPSCSRSRPTGTPATVNCRAAPKLASTRTPTVWPAATRLALPMPPFQPRQLMPVPAPTAPSAN